MVNPQPPHTAARYVDPGPYSAYRTEAPGPAQVAADAAAAQAARAEHEYQRMIQLGWDRRRVWAAHRLHMANLRHLAHAWERRFIDPLAPHALVILYAEPDHEIRAAVRWLLDGDADSLPGLLYQWLGLLRGYAQAAATLDPLVHLDPNHIDQMSDKAQFWGLAVSTLDTPLGGPWREVWPRRRQVDIPGLAYLQLVDGSMTVIDRKGADEYGQTIAYTTHLPQSALWGTWQRVNPEALRRPQPRVWEFLHDLTALIYNSGRTRTTTPPDKAAPPDGHQQQQGPTRHR